MRDANTPLFVGIDGGGTKCKARLEDHNGKLLAEAITGPANASRDLSGSITSLVEACACCLSKAGLPDAYMPELHVGIGLAGVNLPGVKASFLAKSLPFRHFELSTDLHIACLGAHNGQDGSIVIVGTGSSGIAIRGEQQMMLGGHGFQVGDKGSGAWIGKTAVRQCLETLDGIYPANAMAEAIMQQLSCKTAIEIAQQSASAPPAFFASLAPLIFELAGQKQSEALAIICEAARYISQLSDNLLKHSNARFSYIGGVSQPLLGYLAPSVREKAKPAIYAPESGAIHLIKTLLQTETHK